MGALAQGSSRGRPIAVKSVNELEAEATAAISAAESLSALREVEVRFLGRNGVLNKLFEQISAIPAEQRRDFGRAVNEAKAKLEAAVADRVSKLKAIEERRVFASEAVDITLPGRRPRTGLPHVLTQTADRIKSALIGLGFEYYEGPELEEVRFNFSALNYPPDHPAMDDQDTFYIDDERLLRTQCTAIQGRVFGTRTPPLRIFTIGRCFRNEAVDRTHSHTFHQVDAFMVDEGIGMHHLKGTLGAFARAMFGPEVKVRFRPDYFPFVEPGVDYAITNPFQTGSEWLELGGAGLIHPNILRSFGIDTERFSGFAFGLGVDRIAMLQYGIDDLRLLLENDLRFLEQFPA